MPTITQTIEKGLKEFDEKFCCDVKHSVPHPLSCKLCFLSVAGKSFLSHFAKDILESVKEEVSNREVMGLGGDFGIGYEAGFKKAITDISSLLEEEIKKI